MDYSFSLLADAEHLITRSNRRPAQSTLRRCISTLYYALFSSLSIDGVSYFLGNTNNYSNARKLAARSLKHDRMKKICQEFSKPVSNMKDTYKNISTSSNPSDLQLFCKIFVETQNLRHKADYDSEYTFAKENCLTQISEVRNALNSLQRCFKKHPKQLTNFMALILFDSEQRLVQ